jgi:hypothetical protein
MTAALILNPSCRQRAEAGAGFVAKGLIIALGHLARKRTHQFIQQRVAARFRFTPVGIRGAVCHKIEMALAMRRTLALPVRRPGSPVRLPNLCRG